MGRRGAQQSKGEIAGGGGSRRGGSDGGPGALALLSARRLPDVLDEALLAEVHAINATGVDLLVQAAAQAAAPAAGQGCAGALASDAELPLPPGPAPGAWLELAPPQRARVAAQPFLLFSLGLEHGARWRALADEVAAAPAPRRIAESRPRPATVVYARMLLQYAWHLARTAPLTAGLVAGMSPGAVAVLRDCRVEHLDALAERAAAWLRPRWANAPDLWNDLLRAARPDAAGDLARAVALRGVQRAGAALAGHGSAGPRGDGRA